MIRDGTHRPASIGGLVFRGCTRNSAIRGAYRPVSDGILVAVERLASVKTVRC
jgi:hypothetical protein